MTHRALSLLLLGHWLLFALWLNTTGVDAFVIVVSTNDTYIDRIAAFGPRLSDEGVYGYLLPPPPLNGGTTGPFYNQDGCSRVEYAPHSKWIALVERGHCSFIDKVRNMQASGAMAVVVGDREHNGLITMYAPGDTSDVHIPSVFVSQHQFNALLRHVNDSDTPLLVRLVKDDLLQWPLLDVILVVVMSPAFMMLFIYILWRIRQRQRRKKDLAPPSVVSSLPTKLFYKEKRKDNEPEECAICLEDYLDEDELRILPCKHEFHTGCIDGWLTTRKKFCPICKRDICQPREAAASEATPLLEA